MKFTPSLAGAMSGSMGGCTASHNKGGAYFRRRSVPTDPASTFQVTVRAAMALLSQRWVDVLTPAQRAGWDTYAQQVSWTDVLGQSIKLSGLNHYVRSNTPRVVADSYDALYSNFVAAAIIDTAPVVFDLGATPTVVAESVISDAGPPITIEISATLDPPQTGATAYVYMSPGQNPSVTFYKGPYLLVGNFVLGGGGLISAGNGAAESPFTSRYVLPSEGQVIYYGLRVQQTDGRLSSMVRRGPLLVPAPTP